MEKYYFMEHSGTEYYLDELGLRHFYFDMLVNDINIRDFDTIEWLDGTRDLDSQLDFIRFTKYGDINDIVDNLKKYENAYIKEIKNYKELLQFFVDYLNGEITNYELYNRVGCPWKDIANEMLDTLNDVAIEHHMSEYDILLAFIDTKAYEIDEFEETFSILLKNVIKEFGDFLDRFSIKLVKKQEISEEDTMNILELRDFLLNISEK